MTGSSICPNGDGDNYRVIWVFGSLKRIENCGHDIFKDNPPNYFLDGFAKRRQLPTVSDTWVLYSFSQCEHGFEIFMFPIFLISLPFFLISPPCSGSLRPNTGVFLTRTWPPFWCRPLTVSSVGGGCQEVAGSVGQRRVVCGARVRGSSLRLSVLLGGFLFSSLSPGSGFLGRPLSAWFGVALCGPSPGGVGPPWVPLAPSPSCRWVPCWGLACGGGSSPPPGALGVWGLSRYRFFIRLFFLAESIGRGRCGSRF